MDSTKPQITQNYEVHLAYILLKYTYGFFVLIVGIDKFFGLLSYWPQYVSPYILHNFPINLTMNYFLYGVGSS